MLDASQELFSIEEVSSVRRRIVLLYPELRRSAQQLLRRERPNHTLQPTALANEAAARLLLLDRAWDCPDHFVASATRVMRSLLTDYARRRLANKRTPPEDGGSALPRQRDVELLTLDRALDQLATIDQRAAHVVEFRFYGGFSEAESAAALGISTTTVQRDWEFAKTWLYGELMRTPKR